MATHPSTLAWRIAGTEEPGGLLSMGSHRVGHDRSDLAAAAAAGGPQFSELHLQELHQVPAVKMKVVGGWGGGHSLLFPAGGGQQ